MHSFSVPRSRSCEVAAKRLFLSASTSKREEEAAILVRCSVAPPLLFVYFSCGENTQTNKKENPEKSFNVCVSV